MVLTAAQKVDLHKSILAYLKKNGFEEASTAFERAAGIKEVEAKYETLLETKWKSIVRLQKKILELEAINKQLQEDLSNLGKGKKIDATEALPREPSKFQLSGHRAPITAVAFHPSYNIIATASEDSTIKIWDYESGKFERSLQGHQDAVQDVAFNPAGTLIVSCSADLSLKIWTVDTYECVKTLQGHDHNVSSVAFLPSGDAVVSASRDKTIKVWDISSGFCTRTLSGHEQWVKAIAVSPSGSLLASASMDQTIKIWDLKTGICLKTGRDHDHVVESVAFSNAKSEHFIMQMIAENKAPAAAPADTAASAPATSGEAKVAPSTDADKEKDKIKPPKEESGGQFIVSGSRDRTIKIWQVSSGACVKTLTGHDNWVRQVIFHPSGRFLVSCSDDKSVIVWDLSRNGRIAAKLENAHKMFINCVAWNPVIPMMATGSVDNMLHIWGTRS